MSFDLGSIVKGINQVTETVGAVNGAVNVLAPALQNVQQTVNGLANTVNPGYRQDMYAQNPQYIQQQQAIPATIQSVPTTGDSTLSIGSVGNALAGAGIGAMMGTKTAAGIKSGGVSDISTEGIGSKIPAGAKSAVSSGLKAGGIGAVVGGLFSGVQNFIKLSKNEITGAEATGNITADTAVGFFSGVGGLATGTGAAMLMGGMSSMGGMVGAGVAGLIGAVGIDFLMRKTGIRDAIASGVRSIIG